MGIRPTEYLWYDFSNGRIMTQNGRTLDTAPTLDQAASMFPDATFRTKNFVPRLDSHY